MSDEDRSEFNARVAYQVMRFEELEPNSSLSPNTALPGHERINYVLLGMDWSDIPPAGGLGDNFSTAILFCEEGHGASLHAHTTEEMFMVLEGKFVVYWGTNEENETELGRLDSIVIPGPVFRGFRAVGGSGYILSILGGGDPPKPVYPPSIEKRLLG